MKELTAAADLPISEGENGNRGRGLAGVERDIFSLGNAGVLSLNKLFLEIGVLTLGWHLQCSRMDTH